MLLAVVIFCCAVFTGVYGHGRLINPPQRSSAWRYGYEVPANYNDNELFCGGFQVREFCTGLLLREFYGGYINIVLTCHVLRPVNINLLINLSTFKYLKSNYFFQGYICMD